MECSDTVVEEAVLRRDNLALQEDEFAQFVEASKHPPNELRQVSTVGTLSTDSPTLACRAATPPPPRPRRGPGAAPRRQGRWCRPALGGQPRAAAGRARPDLAWSGSPHRCNLQPHDTDN